MHLAMASFPSLLECQASTIDAHVVAHLVGAWCRCVSSSEDGQREGGRGRLQVSEVDVSNLH